MDGAHGGRNARRAEEITVRSSRRSRNRAKPPVYRWFCFRFVGLAKKTRPKTEHTCRYLFIAFTLCICYNHILESIQIPIRYLFCYMELEFKKANVGDFSRVNELFTEMLRTIYQTDTVQGYRPGDLDRFFAGTGDWICLAADRDFIAAFLSIELHREQTDFLYLDDFSVTECYRNRGIGTALFHRAEDYAREVRVQELRFHVEKSNGSALRFYSRLGCEIIGDDGSRFLMAKQNLLQRSCCP